MPLASAIISILKNKYLVTITAFALIMLFFDHNNLFEQMQRKQELDELRAKKQYYLDETEKTKKELADLGSNPAAIEKYAREHFQMKRDNEDIFVVEHTTDSLEN